MLHVSKCYAKTTSKKVCECLDVLPYCAFLQHCLHWPAIKYNYEDKCFGIFYSPTSYFFLTREVTLFFNYKSIPERLLHCGCPLRASGHQWAAIFVGLWIKGGVRWQIQSQRLGTERLPEHRLMWTPFWRRTCAFVMLLALGKRACEMNKCKCKRESVQNLMPEY